MLLNGGDANSTVFPEQKLAIFEQRICDVIGDIERVIV
jgi:hypothetical protein